MATFYIIKSINDDIIAEGRGIHFTQSLNYAKHFTSLWSAQNFMKRNGVGNGWSIKKIVRL